MFLLNKKRILAGSKESLAEKEKRLKKNKKLFDIKDFVLIVKKNYCSH